MKKSDSKSLKYSIAKWSCILLSMFLIFSFSVMSRPLTVSAQISDSNEENAELTSFQKEISESNNYTVEQVACELFGEVNIKSCEYLYNLDDSADYIYVEFDDAGYAVFLKETMELLEYSAQGELNYPENSSSKYYGGPSFYMFKDNGCFVDILSREHLHISSESAKTYANEVRETLLENYLARENSKSVEFDYSSLEKGTV